MNEQYEKARDIAIISEETRAKSLIIDEDKCKQIAEAASYIAVPFLPLSKEFINKFILSDIEYPTQEGKLVQVLMELQSRMNNLAQRSYEFKKTELEIEELKLDIEDIKSEHKDINRDRIKIDKLQLEIVNKQYMISQSHLVIEQVYTEFINWKQTVEDILKTLKVDSIQDIDFTKIKVAEIQSKIKIWKQLDAKRMLEMTPSKMNAILSDLESWNGK